LTRWWRPFFRASEFEQIWEPKPTETSRELPAELKERPGLLLLWRARRANLTDDDLRSMTMADLNAWFELFDWANEPAEDEQSMDASATERAFFHL